MGYDAAVSRNETMSCPSGFERHHPQRLAALHGYAILDTVPEPAFDEIAQIAAASCGTAMARITFADADRHWTKAAFGHAAPDHPFEAGLGLETLSREVRWWSRIAGRSRANRACASTPASGS